MWSDHIVHLDTGHRAGLQMVLNVAFILISDQIWEQVRMRAVTTRCGGSPMALTHVAMKDVR